MEYGILLVDDEKWVRKALTWTVAQTGMPFSVRHECGNGLDALDWLRTNDADIILTDVRMPVMDGISLLRQLPRQGDDTAVIVISVHDDFRAIQEALREGVADYLLKPVEAPEMAACLAKWLARRLNGEAGSKRRETAAEILSPVEQVLIYVRDTPPGEVNLTEAARRVHLNPCYLSQLFKQRMNLNFVDYVTAIRVEEAKSLLTGTTLRMAEIADRLGYADSAYFCHIFKKSTGATPTEYRSQTRQAGRR